MKKTATQLSCQTFEHYTPAKYVEAVRYVLGEIDLDPASCEVANQIVNATLFYDIVTDGLRKPWSGRVFVNPPGDRRGKLVKAFWRKANLHVLNGDAVVIWLGYSIEQLRTLQGCSHLADCPCPSPLQYPLSFPRDRIEFTETLECLQTQLSLLDSARPPEVVERSGDCPTHSNFFALLGGDAETHSRFIHRFRRFGDVVQPTCYSFTETEYVGVCEILAEHGPCTQTQLGRLLGIKRRRLRLIVAELMQHSLIRKQGYSFHLTR